MTNELLWAAVFIQIFMGGTDTILHHEFTERLAWQPSAQKELKLHALRNFIYAGLFITFAWGLPTGHYAKLAFGFIIAEVIITLWDFVEEDLSRKLPATERVLHTLLALNYGAILILLLPELWKISTLPTSYGAVDYGHGSMFLTVAAIGVALFGMRDYLAAIRLSHLIQTPAIKLATALKGKHHILITGATGFVGSRLTRALCENGHAITVLTRYPEKAAKLGGPLTIITGLDQISDDAPIDIIINLAGEPLATGLWSKTKREKILNSRADIADEIYKLCTRLYVAPKVVVSASAIGWYGLRNNEKLDENSTAETCFTHEICQQVETKNDRLNKFKSRVVNLRIGLVLGTQGGMLANLLVPFEYGVGGPIGNGKQWMSWIALDDLVRLIVHTLKNETLNGPVNAVAPNPVQNNIFAKKLGRALNRPSFMPLPKIILTTVLGDFAKELLLASQNVESAKLKETGFEFQASTIEQAFVQILPGNNQKNDN